MPINSRWAAWALSLALAAYLGLIWRASAGLANEDWDGVKTVNNALLAARAVGPAAPLDLERAPLGWLPMAPALAWVYHRGGRQGALAAAHRLWPLYLGLLLLASWAFFRSLFSEAAAAALVALMAANPILIQFAPFALLDIFGGLAALAFVVAARRYLEAPDARRYRALAAAALAAFLSKYHLGVLVGAPLLSAALERKRWRVIAGIGLLAPLCGLGAVVALALLARWVNGAGHDALRLSWGELSRDFSVNLLQSKESRWTLYVEALGRQLGLGLTALFLAGLWAWVRRDGADGRRLAVLLALPYAALAFGIANKEARYAIPLLPLVYAAIGRGLERVRELLPDDAARRAALAGALLLVPWGRSLAALRYLEEEPSVHADVPWALARAAESASREGDCVAWIRGDVAIPIERRLFRYEHDLVIGAPTFQFFTRRRVVERDAASPACPVSIVPRDAPDGRRWPGAELARVSVASGAGGWDVFADRVERRP